MTYFDSAGRRVDMFGNPTDIFGTRLSTTNGGWDDLNKSSASPSKKTSSEDSSSDLSWLSSPSTDTSSSSSSYSGSYGGSYTRRVLTPEEIEERRRQQEAFVKGVITLTLLPLTSLNFVVTKTWQGFRPHQDEAVVKKEAKILTGGIIVTAAAMAMAVNAHNAHLRTLFPTLTVTYGEDQYRTFMRPFVSILPDAAESRSTASEKCNDVMSYCRLTVSSVTAKPDCFKVSDANFLKPDTYSMSYRPTYFYANGQRNNNPVAPHCLKDLTVSGNSASCTYGSEIFYCNNPDSMKLLAEEIKQTMVMYHNSSGVRMDGNVVESVVANSPGHKLGLEKGDIIAMINDRQTEDMNPNAVENYIHSNNAYRNREGNETGKMSIKVIDGDDGKLYDLVLTQDLISENAPITTTSLAKDRDALLPSYYIAALGGAPIPVPSLDPVVANRPAPVASNTNISSGTNVTSNPNASSHSARFTIAASSLNVRTGPGTQHPSKGAFQKGSCVTFLANASNDFVQVAAVTPGRTDVYVDGYVSKDYLTPFSGRSTAACQASFTAK